MPTIELENVANVRRCSIPLAEGGGVTILRGRCGSGKSNFQEAVKTLLSGKGKLSVRDGALNGRVEGFGVKLTLSSTRTNRKGELEVESMEGSFSLAAFVDPGYVDPSAADAARIKNLVKLSGVKPSAELFYPLFGSREALENVVSPAALTSDDLTQMASRIKADCEKAARIQEGRADNADGRARGAKEAAAGVDVKSEADGNKLSATLEAAVREQTKLTSQAESATKAKRAAQAAQDALEDAEASYSGDSLPDAKKGEAASKLDYEEKEASVAQAREILMRAELAWDKARSELAHAIQRRKNAEQHEATIAKWKEQIAASIPEAPTPEAVQAAGNRVTNARQAIEAGAVIRKARQHLADAEKAIEEATGFRKVAIALRESAASVDSVLSEVVAKSCPTLRVIDGRLVTTTARGDTYLSDLSDGERTKLGIDLQMAVSGEGHCLHVFEQRLWANLSPKFRREVADYLREKGQHGIAAEVTDDEELTAEVFETEPA